MNSRFISSLITSKTAVSNPDGLPAPEERIKDVARTKSQYVNMSSVRRAEREEDGESPGQTDNVLPIK